MSKRDKSVTTTVTKPPDIPRPKIKFRLPTMERICLMPFEGFSAFGDLHGEKPDEQYYYKDNGSKILAVAHLDSVQRYKHFVVAEVADETIIYNAQLDDRLGAYLILDLLPRYGVKADILLTTGEESGRSTAKFFKPPEGRQYNWIFSFDRMGTDVVMYDYETVELAKLLRESGCTVSKGSFSDIGCLYELKAAGFNFGCGYEDYHSKLAHVALSDTANMVQQFLHFYRAHRNTYLEHTPKKHAYTGSGRGAYGVDWGDWESDWRKTSAYTGWSASQKSLPLADNREYCLMHNGWVEPEQFVYSQDVCYDCFRVSLKNETEQLRCLIDLSKADQAPPKEEPHDC